jgi:Holliday junction resolvase-like predicted endonuclease
MKYVIKRMLEAGFQILGIESPANGGRIDIIAKAPDDRTIGVEVKTHQGELRELDKIQAALYFSTKLDRIAAANRRTILMLLPEYVQEVRTAAKIVEETLEKQPELGRTCYTPHPDVCRLCQSHHCPYLKPSFSIRSISAG